jgi:uncharacterized protein YndB with AHSA1/START domain
MTVTAIDKDPEARTMRVTAEYDVPVDRVWQLWSDPRLLERWWGPPTYPATVDEYDLSPGGHVAYHMTGPEGDEPRGHWTFHVVDPPHHLELENGFADDAGKPDPTMPTMNMKVDITATDAGSRMSITTTFPSAEAMEQLLAMGMEEGMSGALGQTDAILTELVTAR